MTTTANLASQFSAAIQKAYMDRDNPHRFLDVQVHMARLLELKPADIFAHAFSAAPTIVPMVEERLGAKCRLLLAVMGQAEEADAAVQALSQIVSRKGLVEAAAVCVLSSYGDWYIQTIICRPSDSIGARVRDILSPSAEIVTPFTGPSAAMRGPGGSATQSPLMMDERILRMARLALASSSAIVLVGPPGTGKTTLVKKLLQEVACNPAAFGLAKAPREPKWTTPSQAWTASDLIGGEMLDENGRRRFRLGHVLEALRQDKWLVLDEVNRADMDKIFGPLLTWLSDQRVELGRASTDVASPTVVLDWNDRPECKTLRLELLEAERIVSSDPIRFLAGLDWRLIGTYNVQDAHRVFSFGHALGRRFARVPIPAIEPSQFRHVLAPIAKCMPESVTKVILGLYTAHRRSSCQLGPAIFLKIASYVAAGIKLPSIAGSPIVPTRGGGQTDADLLMQLVAEAYMCSAGAWLAQLPAEELDSIGKVILEAGFPKSDWDWLRALNRA